MKIKKLRKKLKNKKWVESELKGWCNNHSYWMDFHTWKCNSFFVGDALAELNQREYEENINRANRHITFLKKILSG